MKIAIITLTFAVAVVLGFVGSQSYHVYQIQQQQAKQAEIEEHVQDLIAAADSKTPSVNRVVVNGEAK